MSFATTWGTDPDERRLPFPCDTLIPRADAQLFRGVTIEAAPDVVFRWLCQLRAAPYSYDWIDNGGRQSPQVLVPGLEQLKVGQEVMSIFKLTSFAPNKHLTIQNKPRGGGRTLFGDIAVSYLIVPRPDGKDSCRLLVKLVVRYSHSLKGRLMRNLLPFGDLVMMRRQLLNLKRLAEQTQIGST